MEEAEVQPQRFRDLPRTQRTWIVLSCVFWAAVLCIPETWRILREMAANLARKVGIGSGWIAEMALYVFAVPIAMFESIANWNWLAVGVVFNAILAWHLKQRLELESARRQRNLQEVLKRFREMRQEFEWTRQAIARLDVPRRPYRFEPDGEIDSDDDDDDDDPIE